MCLNKQDASQAVLLLKICDGSKQHLKISSASAVHIQYLVHQRRTGMLSNTYLSLHGLLVSHVFKGCGRSSACSCYCLICSSFKLPFLYFCSQSVLLVEGTSLKTVKITHERISRAGGRTVSWEKKNKKKIKEKKINCTKEKTSSFKMFLWLQKYVSCKHNGIKLTLKLQHK